MRLDEFQAVAKKRTQWQALDLGLIFARNWYWKLVLLWLIPSCTLFILLSIVFYKTPSAVAIVVWWLKPLWERGLIFLVSRELFGQKLTVFETLKLFKSYLVPDIVMPLTIRRFASTRSYNMPIAVLEKLKGRARAQRADLVNRRFSNAALWSLVGCVHIEFFLLLGFAAGVFMFVPQSVSIDWELWVFDREILLTHIYNVLWFIAATLVAPVYVCSGFALYLQRRVDLEAWDIEILFRKLKQRKQLNNRTGAMPGIVLILVIGASISFVPNHAVATEQEPIQRELAHEHETVVQQVTEIYAGEDFTNIEHKQGFRLIPKDEKPDSEIPEGLINFIEWMEANGAFFKALGKFLQWIATYIEVVLWSIFIALILFVFIRYRDTFRDLLERVFASKKTEVRETPSVLFGLEVTQESLPDDVAKQALTEWKDGKHRAAMALLLRASIVELMHVDGCQFSDGYTEAECSMIVEQSLNSSLKSKLFATLVSHWQTIAYAHREIQQFSFEAFCSDWGEQFSAA